MNIIEEIEQLNEKKRALAEAPTTLMLQLKYVQPFPNGQKVALYFCPTIKKFFSFVYGKDGIITEEEFSIIEKLKTIEEVEPLYFHDGSTLNIDKQCSESILNLYENVSEGKSDFEDFIIQSDKHFLSILNYSVNRFKKET